MTSRRYYSDEMSAHDDSIASAASTTLSINTISTNYSTQLRQVQQQIALRQSNDYLAVINNRAWMRSKAARRLGWETVEGFQYQR
jgi:hypothetical protein